VAAADRSVRAGEWQTWSPTAWLGVDVFGATLGIIGLGEIGEAVARRARGFGMTILYNSRTRKPEIEASLGLEWCELDELLQRADFVSIHTPLTEHTRNLLGEREFGLMQSHALLVNTARGQVVDQAALVRALKAGRIGGAALDVTDPEPLPGESPLLRLPNVTVLPHIGSASFATRARMARMAAENIIAALDGRRPPNAVNEPRQPKE
jgi:glyoxylate reductase